MLNLRRRKSAILPKDDFFFNELEQQTGADEEVKSSASYSSGEDADEVSTTAGSEYNDCHVLPELMEAISLCDRTTMSNLQRTRVREEPLSARLKKMPSLKPRRKRLETKKSMTMRELASYEKSLISFRWRIFSCWAGNNIKDGSYVLWGSICT